MDSVITSHPPRSFLDWRIFSSDRGNAANSPHLQTLFWSFVDKVNYLIYSHVPFPQHSTSCRRYKSKSNLPAPSRTNVKGYPSLRPLWDWPGNSLRTTHSTTSSCFHCPVLLVFFSLPTSIDFTSLPTKFLPVCLLLRVCFLEMWCSWHAV